MNKYIIYNNSKYLSLIYIYCNNILNKIKIGCFYQFLHLFSIYYSNFWLYIDKKILLYNKLIILLLIYIYLYIYII